MNIFAIDINPVKAAMQLHNKHIVKMILESAQMLSTTQRLYGNNNFLLYLIAYPYHPSTIWVRESQQNYIWLFIHLEALLQEYTYRYKKFHKVEFIKEYLRYPPIELKCLGLTRFALAMPDKYKEEDPIQSYRNYYIGEKIQGNFWTNRKYELDYWLLPHIKDFQFKERFLNV